MRRSLHRKCEVSRQDFSFKSRELLSTNSDNLGAAGGLWETTATPQRPFSPFQIQTSGHAPWPDRFRIFLKNLSFLPTPSSPVFKVQVSSMSQSAVNLFKVDHCSVLKILRVFLVSLKSLKVLLSVHVFLFSLFLRQPNGCCCGRVVLMEVQIAGEKNMFVQPMSGEIGDCLISSMDLLRSYPCPWIDFTAVPGPSAKPIRNRFCKALTKDATLPSKQNVLTELPMSRIVFLWRHGFRSSLLRWQAATLQNCPFYLVRS